MTKLATLFAGAAALAMATPAAAQTQVPDAAVPDGVPEAGAPDLQTWQDVSRPSVRFVQVDGQGNVLFDSGAARRDASQADGVDRSTADAIAQADGATTGATDAQGGQGGDSMSFDTAEGREPGAVDGLSDSTSEAIAEADGQTLAETDAAQGTTYDDAGAAEATDVAQGDNDAGPADTRTAPLAQEDMQDVQAAAADAMPQGQDGQTQGGQQQAGGSDAVPTDGSRGGADVTERLVQPELAEQVPGASVPFDVDSFAREMFEQGYRQGYVSAMTRLRSDAARQMRDGGMQRGDFRAQARDTRQGMQGAMPSVYSDGQGGAVVVLPRGVNPQQFMQMLREQQARQAN